MRRSTVAALWLIVTASVCGGVVMAVELLGARMLSVGYGGSLIVWAAMISVTLLSLALGYFIGGLLADLAPRPWLLHVIVIIAAGLVAACPCFGFVLERFYDRMGLQLGALTSSLVIFFAPLCLLGMVGPFVIRLLTKGRRVGVTAGGVYALSTLGSVAGTLGTAMLLIPECGTGTGFRIVAGVTAATGAIGLVTAVGWESSVALLLPFALAFFPGPRGHEKGEMFETPTNRPAVVLDVLDSPYGQIMVVEIGSERAGERLLVVNGIQQTGMSATLRRGQAQHGELLAQGYHQELLPYLSDAPVAGRAGDGADTRRTALLIGLAGGTTAAMFRNHHVHVTAVDLDPKIIEVARKWFAYPSEGEATAVAADGRRFLEDCDRRFDFCVIDTYSGDTFPFQLATVEAFRAARRVLKPGGVLAVNFIGRPGGRPFASVHRTLAAVFPHVLAIRDNAGDDVQTVTIFASDRSIREELNRARDRMLDDQEFCPGGPMIATVGGGPRPPGSSQTWDHVVRLIVAPDADAGMILTDAHSPIDLMRMDEAVRWRQLAIERLGRNILF